MDRSLIANVRIQIVRRTQLTDTDEGSIFSDLHAANHHSLLLQRATIATCDRIRNPDRRQRASHRLMIFQRRTLNNISPYTYQATPVFEMISSAIHTFRVPVSRRSGGRDEGTWRVPRHTHAQEERDRTLTRARSRPTTSSYGRYVIF